MEKQLSAKEDCTTCIHASFELLLSGERNLDVGYCDVELILPNSFLGCGGKCPQKKMVSQYTKPDCPLWDKDIKTEQSVFRVSLHTVINTEPVESILAHSWEGHINDKKPCYNVYGEKVSPPKLELIDGVLHLSEAVYGNITVKYTLK